MCIFLVLDHVNSPPSSLIPSFSPAGRVPRLSWHCQLQCQVFRELSGPSHLKAPPAPSVSIILHFLDSLLLCEIVLFICLFFTLVHKLCQAPAGPLDAKNTAWNITRAPQIAVKSVMKIMRWAGIWYTSPAQRQGELVSRWPFEGLGLCSPWNHKAKLETPGVSFCWDEWRLQKLLRERGGVQGDLPEVNTQTVQCQDGFLGSKEGKSEGPRKSRQWAWREIMS